jgi:Tol biopolymer transport system component
MRTLLIVDGKRLAFLRQTLERDVYVSELQANGTKMKYTSAATLDERQDFPCDWTPDSNAVLFTSDRDGAYHIFRQGIASDRRTCGGWERTACGPPPQS